MEETLQHSTVEAAYDYSEWVLSIDRQLCKYSEEMRHAFIDHYLNGKSLADLAGELGITVNALAQRFRRMRETLAAEAGSTLKHIDCLLL